MKHSQILGLSAVCLAAACTGNVDKAYELMPGASANYSQIVHDSYADSVTTAKDLDAAIQALVANPSASTMKAAQDAWLASREPYLQTEVYRFYEGPIDNEADGPEGLLNAWPMDESHVDYTIGQGGLSNSGIVNDTSITIDAATLESKNEEGGEENVATGYHALEFLLWGQDFSADGPGSRSHIDYLDRGDAGSFGCYDTTYHTLDCEATTADECSAGTIWVESACAINSDRRGDYLTTASTMMIGHLESLETAWNTDGMNYRADFEAAAADEQLRRIMTGMVILSGFETGGERLQTALDTGDQEDEHSCFSDNTHRDMIQDIQGVQNVFLGTYGAQDGVGIKDVIAELDSGLASRLEEEIAASLAAANALQPPFDQEILNGNDAGRARVQALIDALRIQEATLEEAFVAFGLDVPVAE